MFQQSTIQVKGITLTWAANPAPVRFPGDNLGTWSGEINGWKVTFEEDSFHDITWTTEYGFGNVIGVDDLEEAVRFAKFCLGGQWRSVNGVTLRPYSFGMSSIMVGVVAELPVVFRKVDRQWSWEYTINGETYGSLDANQSWYILADCVQGFRSAAGLLKSGMFS